MRDGALLFMLFASSLGWGCSGADEAPRPTSVAEAPPTPTVTPTATPAPTPSVDPAPTVTHGASAAERIARMQANDGEAERMRARDTHLREGRRLAHADDHEGALRELEAGLAITPTDATLRCEAGLQAYRLARLDVAFDHLTRGVARSGAPATEAACLYNLGRVLEDRGNSIGAAQCYVDSLRLRRNTTVSERLATLRTTTGDEAEEEIDSGWDEDEGRELGLEELDRAEPFESIAALCAATGGACSPRQQRWAPPTPSPTLLEVFVIEMHSDEELLDIGYFIVHDDEGFRAIGQVTSSDTTDNYGRLEAVERVSNVRFETGRVLVEIEGHEDEPAGEAEAYWRCERQLPDDDDARERCFDTAREALGDPEEWTAQFWFRLEEWGYALEE